MKYCLIILITLPLLVTDTVSAQDQPLYTSEMGIAPYTFRRSFPNGVAATLDTIKMMGFTEIEGGGASMDAAAYKKLCSDRGICIPSMGVGYEQLLENPQEVITRAKTYGANYVMVAWIPHEVGHFNFENAQKAALDFNKVGKILASQGITLCYHAHGYEFQKHGHGTLLDYLMEYTDPNYVSFEMDIFWIQYGGGDPVQLLEKYGNRWKLMHLKDMKKGIAKDLRGLTDPEYDVALGTGQIDIAGVLKAARKAGIKHYFIEDESSRILQQLPASISYLKGLKE